MKNRNLVNAWMEVGLTQKEVAAKAGITEVSYQRLEYRTQSPSLRTAILIVNALGVKDVRSLCRRSCFCPLAGTLGGI